MRNLVFWLSTGALAIAVLDFALVTLPTISEIADLRRQSAAAWDADLERLRSGPPPTAERTAALEQGAAEAARQADLAEQYFYGAARSPLDRLGEDPDRPPADPRAALVELLHTLGVEVLADDALLERKLGLLLPNSSEPLLPADADRETLEDQAERALVVRFFLDTLRAHPEVRLYDLSLRRNRDDDRLMIEWRLDGPPADLVACASGLLQPTPQLPPRQLSLWRLRRLEPSEWGFTHHGKEVPPCRFEGRALLFDPRWDTPVSAPGGTP